MSLSKGVWKTDRELKDIYVWTQNEMKILIIFASFALTILYAAVLPSLEAMSVQSGGPGYASKG